MPYAFILLLGFLVVWGQIRSEDLDLDRTRTTHAQIDSAVSAIVYYGTFTREVANYRAADGTQPNKAIIAGGGDMNQKFAQIRASGTMPGYLSWFKGMAGLNGYADPATQQLWVYFYVPAANIHPVDSPGGLIGSVSKKAVEKFGSQILTGQVLDHGSGVKQVYPVLIRTTAYADPVPAQVPSDSIVYRVPLGIY